MSITNNAIIAKIEEKTMGDEVMKEFVIGIISYENENAQYSSKYKKLIEKAVEERCKKNAI